MPTRRARSATTAPPPGSTESPDAAAIADRVHSAAIHLLRSLRREDTAGGLSAPRLSALSVVVFGGPITIGALAAAEQVRPPTMTRLVAALEAEGLVARDADPRDGRMVRIRATARGERVLAAGRARRVAALAQQVAALPANDQAMLARAAAIVESLAADARRASTPPTPPRR